MKAGDIVPFLVKAFGIGAKVLLKGMPGVGKSEMVAQATTAADMDLLITHPQIKEPTDYTGMPWAGLSKDGIPRAEFLPFGDLRQLIEATRPTVCFIDDIGQAPILNQAALMQLIQQREVNGHRVSDHIVFCGATNDTSHLAGVQPMIEPLKSRWETIVEVEVDVDGWCRWALANGVPAEVIGFIRFRPELLCKFEPNRELRNTPNPRTVARTGLKWVANGILNHEVIAGGCGEGWAAEFGGWMQVWKAMPSIDRILVDPHNARVPDEPSARYAVASALVRRATEKNFARILEYSARLPKEFDVMIFRDALQHCPDLESTKAATEWAIQNSDVYIGNGK